MNTNDIFNDTKKIKDLNKFERVRTEHTIKYLDDNVNGNDNDEDLDEKDDDEIFRQGVIEEEYTDSSFTTLGTRVYYNFNTGNIAYKELFINNVSANDGFVSEITKGDSDEVIGYRYYRDKLEFHSNNYFTIVKNRNFKPNMREPEYLIVSNCGGTKCCRTCNDIMFNLLHNQFKDKHGYEITGNKIITNAFVATLQQQYKNHPSINLCNINLGNRQGKEPIVELDKITNNLPSNRISLIPINTDGHATVLIYNPDGEKNNRFHLFDSSGALSNNTKKMGKIFGENNREKINVESLNMNNIQINGCCTI